LRQHAGAILNDINILWRELTQKAATTATAPVEMTIGSQSRQRNDEMSRKKKVKKFGEFEKLA
jgi:hypothetical protein